MSYNSQIPDQQGAVKASEIFTDQQLEIIKNNVGDTVLASLQGMMKPVSDAIRYNNFVLHSTGQMFWENTLGVTSIKFDSDAQANNIVLTLYVMDEAAVSRTVDVVIQGTTGANSLTAFNSITLAANELVYLEISRAELLAATSGTPSATPGQLVLENGITGGSTASGKRVLKTTLTGTVGMPAMIADMNSLTQSNSQTVNIPLAVRYDWTDGLTTFPDLWWIPHGIRWPSNVRSVVGAVVVSGFEALPNYFVRSELELNQALTALSSDGGIIVPTQSFSITGAINVPSNVTIMGRSSKYNGVNNAKITVNNGSGFVLQANAGLVNLPIIVQAAFGSSGVANVVSMAASGSSVSNCEFSLLSTTPLNLGNTRCVTINASYCKVQENFFTSTTAGATAIYFTTGFTNNLVTFTRVSNVTENVYQDNGRSLGTRSDYGMIPVGCIIPWLGASYINGSNGSPLSVTGATSIASLSSYLGDGWIICDGRAIPASSPLRSGGNTFAPNITSGYFLRGSTSTTNIGGSSTATLAIGNLPSHTHTIDHGHSNNFAVAGDFATNYHSHNYSHYHQWGYKNNSGGERLIGLRTPASSITGFTGISASTQYIIANSVGGTFGTFGAAATGGYDDFSSSPSPLGAWYTTGVSGGVNGTGSSASTGGPSSGANPTLSGSVTSYSGSSGPTGSATSFSIIPPYIDVIYIMRVK